MLHLPGSTCSAQDTTRTVSVRAAHSIFLDVGGLAYPLSLNYTFSVPLAGRVKAGVRTGISYYLAGKPRSALFPLEACFLYGGKVHHAEVAIGYTLIYSRYLLGRGNSLVYDPSPVLTLHFGYRLQLAQGGYFMRLGWIIPITIREGYVTDLDYALIRQNIVALGFGITIKAPRASREAPK